MEPESSLRWTQISAHIKSLQPVLIYVKARDYSSIFIFVSFLKRILYFRFISTYVPNILFSTKTKTEKITRSSTAQIPVKAADSESCWLPKISNALRSVFLGRACVLRLSPQKGMADCDTTSGCSRNHRLSHIYAWSLGRAFQAASMKLCSRGLTGAYKGADFDSCLLNTSCLLF